VHSDFPIIMTKYGSVTQLSRKIDKLSFIYGTACKKDETTVLVKEALSRGFRAVDTACQPRHYREELVGKAIREALEETNLTREEIWVCCRFDPILQICRGILWRLSNLAAFSNIYTLK
jgi:aryl-alcohol dehydrogenase-like predicted oxidoreductase